MIMISQRNTVNTNKVYLEPLSDYEYENVKPVLFELIEKVCRDNSFDKDFLKAKR